MSRFLIISIMAISLLAFIATPSVNAAVLALYEFNPGDRTGSSDIDPDSNAQDIVFGNATGQTVSYNSSNQLEYGNSDYFGGNNATARNDALAAGQYVAVTVDALPGLELNLDSFSFEYNRRQSAPRRVALYAATNGGSAFTFLQTQTTGNSSFLQPFDYDLSTLSAYQGLTSVEFRIVPFEDNSNRAPLRIDNIILNGEVIPEPASLVLLGAGSLLMLSRRRK